MYDFSQYSHREAMTSLTTLSVRVLCRSVKKIIEGSLHLSPLYDENTWNEDETWHMSIADILHKRYSDEEEPPPPPPKRLLEVLYENNTEPPLLNIESRQAILDYVIRADIPVRAEFVLYLLKDGGVYHFEIWKIYSKDTWSRALKKKIFTQICTTSNVLRKLAIFAENVDQNVWKEHLMKVKFPNLKELFLSSRNDMEFPFRSCPNLVKLGISEENHGKKSATQLSRCLKSKSPMLQSLSELSVSKISEDEIMLFLANLPKITTLHLTNFEKLLNLLNRTATKSSPKQQIAKSALKVLANLRNLHIDEPMSSFDIEPLIKVCPKLEVLRLTLMDGMELQKLSRASKLRKLQLFAKSRNYQPDGLTFKHHVVPLLEVIGSRLTAISLHSFNVVNLADFARLCPNLEALAVSEFHSLITSGHGVAKPFSQLKSLQLLPVESTEPAALCSILMNAHQLEEVDIFGGITDDLLHVIHLENPLKMLKTFSLQFPLVIAKCSTLAKILSASLACGNLVHHDCGLSGECFLEPDGTIVNSYNYNPLVELGYNPYMYRISEESDDDYSDLSDY